MGLLKAALGQEEFAQLQRDLAYITEADDIILHYLAKFLDSMDREVDAITHLLRAGDVAGAIARKLAFEDQISPTFRRSKELFAEITERLHAVRSA